METGLAGWLAGAARSLLGPCWSVLGRCLGDGVGVW